MRTRILEVRDGNGKTIYYPQYQRYFIWFKFEKYEFCITDVYPIAVQFTNLFEAKRYIDEQVETNELLRKGKIKRKTVINYP